MRRCAVLLALLAGCHFDPLGKPCERDEQCGTGYDCFKNVCFQVCTQDSECREGQRCFRYHCIVPGQDAPVAQAKPEPRAAAPSTPPVPDATVAELRAIRHELELMRRDLDTLLQAHGSPGDLRPTPSPPPAPKH